MKCEIVGCEEEATLWSRYNNNTGFAMCKSHADSSAKFSENPDKCSSEELTPKVAKLLQELHEMTISDMDC